MIIKYKNGTTKIYAVDRKEGGVALRRMLIVLAKHKTPFSVQYEEDLEPEYQESEISLAK